MATGIVVSVNPARRGDTLMAATLATDTVLNVKTVIAFGDEDGGWVKIGTAGPFQYLSANESTNTITLAAPVGAVYEAGLDVNLFDPTVVGGGHDVIEYVASVRRESGGEPFPATIDHTTIPLSDVLNLEGARVEVEQASDDAWYVSRVIAREPVISNVDIVGGRFLTSYEGNRVVVQPTGTNAGGVLFYTGSASEDPPDAGTGYLGGAGYVASTSTDLGGGSVVLQTSIAGPKITGAPSKPVIGLSTSKIGATYETYVTINAAKLMLNGDRVETPNLFLSAAPTTGNPANVRIGAAGQLLESTSSRRFKQDIENADIDLAAVLKIVARKWRDRLEVEADPDTTNQHIGVIAEEIYDLGLTDFVECDEEGPRAVKDGRMWLAVLAVVQDQEERIKALEDRLLNLP